MAVATLDRTAEYLKKLETQGASIWQPQDGPQVLFHESLADELLYGGAAGGGKSESLLVEAIRYTDTPGYHAILLRRTFPELTRSDGLIPRSQELLWNMAKWRAGEHRWYFPTKSTKSITIDFGHMEKITDHFKYQSGAYTYLGFDELTSFLEMQYLYMISRVRSTAGVPKRIRAATNPGNEGHDWVFRRWGPWLDPTHHNPAAPGELRWFCRLNSGDTEVEGPDFRGPKGERPMSRSFIPAFVYDNPALMIKDPEYINRLDSLPEPYRSQLRDGNWLVGHEHEWQVIPHQWVRAAMDRWTPEYGEQFELDAVACDPARGVDKATVGYKRGPWVGPIDYFNERDTMYLIGEIRRVYGEQEGDGLETPARIDVIGIGAGIYDRMREIAAEMRQDPRQMRHIVEAYPFNASEKSSATDHSGLLEMYNARAEMTWHMRELLDPDNPLDIEEPIRLPPDKILLADLTAPRWRNTSGGILVESKMDIKKRIGRSTDAGDLVCMLFYGLGGAGVGRGGIWV